MSKPVDNEKLLNTITPVQFKSLQNKNIYWGHMSVGLNIINGIKDIIREDPELQLNIIEKDNPVNEKGPFFAHSLIGKNTKPKSKVDDFVKNITNSSKNINIAFMKFCYVDITEQTNVDEIFSYYKKSMDNLIHKYPKIKFIHMTVPLTTTVGTATRFKDLIKKILGQKTWDQTNKNSNINRYKYNKLLIQKYGENNIFDLAKYESTTLEGKRKTFEQDGTIYYKLSNEYTSDGGHLNKSGRKEIAKQLLVFLSKL